MTTELDRDFQLSSRDIKAEDKNENVDLIKAKYFYRQSIIGIKLFYNFLNYFI